MTGVDRLFEGEVGFSTAYFGGQYDREAILADLGREYRGAGTMYKLWPSVGTSHSHIHATIELMAEHGPGAGVHPGDPGLRRRLPQPDVHATGSATSTARRLWTPSSACPSSSHWLRCTVGKRHSFHRSGLHDDRVRAWPPRSSRVEDSALDWKLELPPGRVELTTVDGRRFTKVGDNYPGSAYPPTSWEPCLRSSATVPPSQPIRCRPNRSSIAYRHGPRSRECFRRRRTSSGRRTPVTSNRREGTTKMSAASPGNGSTDSPPMTVLVTGGSRIRRLSGRRDCWRGRRTPCRRPRRRGEPAARENSRLCPMSNFARMDLRDTDSPRVSGCACGRHRAPGRRTDSGLESATQGRTRHQRRGHLRPAARSPLATAAGDSSSARPTRCMGRTRTRTRAPAREDQPWVCRGINMYAATKLASEAYLEAFAGLGRSCVLALRIGPIYGPRVSPGPMAPRPWTSCESLDKGEKPTVAWAKDAIHSFVYIDDVARPRSRRSRQSEPVWPSTSSGHQSPLRRCAPEPSNSTATIRHAFNGRESALVISG